MSNIIMRYEDYLIHTKHASDNTVASYMRDLRQYASYLGSEGVDVLDADQAVVSGYMGSMKAGGKSAATISRALASAKRVQTALDMPDEKSGTENGDTSDAYIEFRNVGVTYADGSTGVKNINFKVNKGETIGVIGGTGSGKSTVVNLLPRLYDVSEGAVFLDGKDVRSYPLKELRKKVGSALQRPAIFKGTIRSNVLPLGEADEERLSSAVDTAQARDVVNAKENGYDSVLEQNGRNLSGGQKQRISVARAIAKRPEVLILDDSSSALDNITDLKLRRAIKSLDYPVTTFIVSQRASSVLGADKIIVMDEGEIVGIGTADELRKTCAVFREIEDSQSSSEARK